MAVKCIHCGGACVEIGNGEYECQFCGSTFSRDEVPGAQKASVPAAQSSDSGADVFEKNINGILEISCVGRQGAWSGSGYLITGDGYAVTNAHVAADEDGSPCGNIKVKVCNQIVAAKVVALADNRAGSGNGIDLAVIKLSQIPFGAKPLSFALSSPLRNGEQVYVIGNSLGYGTCITSGVISDKARRLNDGKTYIMTDCAVNGGNSGGPIFNNKGQVIGTIVSRGLAHDGSDAEGMNYAIPLNNLTEFLNRLNIRVNG